MVDEDEQGSTTDDIGQDYGNDYESDEDQGHQPDEEWEGVDELVEAEAEDGEGEEGSDVGSRPSEYPSTQQPSGLYADGKGAFQIHVDEVYDDGQDI